MFTTDALASALEGRYTIERLVGEGGMAKVYLARDLRHNRQVALKVLRPDLGAVLGVDRFQSEIQVTANLQHPNLLPLFDSGAAGDLLFYVMPFVEGESLRARLDREKQLPVDEAVRISTAIAAALDYAHRKGVIHRDLKPENILLHEGQPLVADFGIALAISNAGGARITQTGLSLGTPQYMSPEQATGDRTIDGRTDVYSLGAVTYEMLAGEPPHTGGTSQAIIARVLTETPRAIRTTRPNVPEHVDAAIACALEKIPADRFATANEFALALQGKGDRVQTRAANGVVSRASMRRPAARELAAWAAAISGVAIAGWFASRSQPVATPGRFLVESPESVPLAADPGNRLALSRTGGNLVFVANKNGRSTELYIRRANDVAVAQIRGTDSARAPAFSPRGDWIVFGAGRSLRRVPTSGGVPQPLATSTDGPVLGTAWTDGDQIIYRSPSALWSVPASGGVAKRIAIPDTARGIWSINSFDILPGGKYVVAAFVTTRGSDTSSESTQLGLVNLADGTQSKLGIDGAKPHFVQPGFILFSRESELFAVPFSPRAQKVTGVPARVTEITQGTDITASENGWLAMTTAEVREATTVWRVNAQGSATQLKIDPQPFIDVRISPDGQRVVMHASPARFDEGTLWIYDLKSGSLTPLTTKGSSFRPNWSRDGQRVYYMSGKALVSFVLSRPWDGSGAESTHLKARNIAEVSIGPPHGLSALRTYGLRDIFLAPTESLQAMRPFIESPVNEEGPEISPNGRWLAYHSDESKRREVYVRPIPGPGARVQISVSGGSQPRWSSDGKTLFYRTPRYIASATVAERPQFDVVKRDSLFLDDYERSPGPAWDVFPNGREFLMLRGRMQPRRIYVIVNWRQLLDQSTGSKTSP